MSETVSSGATSTGISVTEVWSIYGTAVSFTVSNGGQEIVYSGGTASFTTVSSGGHEILSGGTTVSTTVDPGGDQIVYRVGRPATPR